MGAAELSSRKGGDREKQASLMSWICSSAAVPPPPPRPMPPPPTVSLARERRRSSSSCVDWGFVPRGESRIFFPYENDGDRREIGRGGIPEGFNRTHHGKIPGLNPRESDPGCQTGIQARSRPGWEQPNKA
jgi:hypothetical protein